MEIETLPGPLKKLQGLLEPYVKKRDHVAHVRRVSASHLNSYVKQQNHLSRPLSLIENTSSVDAAPHGIRGIQKEYLRCARANVKARHEYALLRKVHHGGVGGHGEVGQVISQVHDNPEVLMQSFLCLTEIQQKHERLKILQDHIDMLSQKPAATPEYLDPKVVLKDVKSLPQVPPEISDATNGYRVSGEDSLNEIVDQLEKCVLRAKLLLKSEQKLLEKIQAEKRMSSAYPGNEIEALGTARNELINWIETELVRAGESSKDPADTPSKPLARDRDYIESQLASAQKQYSRYTKFRESLIKAINGDLATPDSTEVDEETDVLSATELVSRSSSTLISSVYPYLEEIVSVSNEQKAIIQQKSYLTITLAKQLKEAGQGLDRLADESHLQPAHPISPIGSQRKGLGTPISFGDEISSHETQDSSRRAQAWVFAAESARVTTRDFISETLEEAGVAILEAQETLLELLGLLGDDIEMGLEEESTSKDGAAEHPGDIWSSLHGGLGAISKGHEDD